MSGSVQAPPTATMTVSSGAAAINAISNGYYPAEGSRCVSAQYNWTSQAAFNEDLGQLEARGVESVIQSAFIDNSTNSQSVTIVCNGTGHVLVCPANNQGAFPLLLTGQPGFTISTPGQIAAVTRVYLLNIPMGPAVWHV